MMLPTPRHTAHTIKPSTRWIISSTSLLLQFFFQFLFQCRSHAHAFVPHHTTVLRNRQSITSIITTTTATTTAAANHISPTLRRPSPSSLFAGGGFGATSSSSGKKKKKKKRNGRLQPPPPKETTTTTDSSSSATAPSSPKLDRFGLPIQTIDDLFPPPTSGEIIGVEDESDTKMSEVKVAMEGYLPIEYGLFGEDGVEREELCGGDERRVPWKLKLLHRNPPVIVIEDFFTPAECQEYISITTDSLQVNSKTFSSLASSTRTSTTWYCHFSQVPSLLAKTKRLLGGPNSNNFPLERMEETQIVRYRMGEEFSWHYDEVPTPAKANGGQRIGTLLVYLNTLGEESGGGTVFRDLLPPSSSSSSGQNNLTMRPKEGSALLFFPALEDGTPDDRTLHKGEVAVDEKMIAQMWLHERIYEPVVPEGNSHGEARDVVERREIELGFR